jgi:hypothetical protein
MRFAREGYLAKAQFIPLANHSTILALASVHLKFIGILR